MKFLFENWRRYLLELTKAEKKARRRANKLKKRGVKEKEFHSVAKGDISIDMGKERERKNPVPDVGEATHLEVRLSQRLGVPLQDTPRLAQELLDILSAHKPENVNLTPHGGTSRILIPVPGWGGAFLWHYKEKLIFRTWFPPGSEVGIGLPPGWKPSVGEEMKKIIEKYTPEEEVSNEAPI